MTERTAHRTCPLCEATCGLVLSIADEEVTVIRGDRDDTFSRGFICPKGSTLGRLHTDPDRLRSPLVRRDGRHVETTWSEAFAEIDRRLGAVREAHGDDALGVYVGNPNAHNFESAIALKPLLRATRTRNIFSASTVDQRPKEVANAYLYGGGLLNAVPDLDRTRFILILGANPYESNGSLASAPDWPGRLEAIRARGGKVVVVDPRRTRTAAEADEHLSIRPGTDAALLLAMVNCLFDENLVAPGRLAEFTAGIDEVAAAVESISPERVEAWTRVAASDIRRLTRQLAGADRGCVYGRIGTHAAAFGTLAAWACDVLNLLTGNLDRAGGVMFPSPIHEPRSRAARSFQVGRWKSRVRGLDEAFGELPVATLVDEIETGGAGQIQALITVAGNPVLTTPEGDRLGRALAGLEFMVSVDPYLNETTRHADVILPPPSALERSHYDLAFASLVVHNHARYSPAVFPATGPSEFEILVTLTGIVMGMGPETDPSDLADAALLQQIAAATTVPGSPIEGREPQELMAMLDRWEGAEKTLDFMIRMGAGGDGFGRDPDGWTLDAIVAQPHGVDRGPLVERLPGILATASGKIELAPPPLLADVARLEAAMGEAPPALVLVGRRDLRSNNSWLHNVEVLVKGKERCTMQIHPDDAERLGLVDGEAATVTSRAGTLEVPVSVTEDIAPGVVSIPYGWGHDQPETRLSVASRRPGVNVNRLTDGSIIDPLSGNAVLNGIPVSVTPVG